MTISTPLIDRPAPPSLLEPASRVELAHAARRLAYRPADWRHAVRFDPAARTYTRIPLSPEHGYEAWLLTWMPGQGTGLHDHHGSAGAFVVVVGTLTEDTAEQDTLGWTTLRERVLHTGDVRPFSHDHVHEVRNDGELPAVSIHVYAPTLSAMNRYSLDDGRLVTTSHDRAGIEW